MRKNVVLGVLAGVMCVSLAACSGNSVSSSISEESSSSTVSSKAASQTELSSAETSSQAEAVSSEVDVSSSEQPKLVDLSGEWKQVGGNSDTNYQIATIQGDSIEIYWVNGEEETKALYWAGSCTVPENATDNFSWDSINDTEKTANAIMASSDETKTFTYDNGKISYEVSAMGMTHAVYLEKQ